MNFLHRHDVLPCPISLGSCVIIIFQPTRFPPGSYCPEWLILALSVCGFWRAFTFDFLLPLLLRNLLGCACSRESWYGSSCMAGQIPGSFGHVSATKFKIFVRHSLMIDVLVLGYCGGRTGPAAEPFV